MFLKIYDALLRFLILPDVPKALLSCVPLLDTSTDFLRIFTNSLTIYNASQHFTTLFQSFIFLPQTVEVWQCFKKV